MDSKFNTITFCTADYMEYNDYLHKEVANKDEMFDDIKEFIRIATKNGYQMKIWYDEMTVVIEFNYRDEAFTGVGLEWLGEDEYIETLSEVDNDESNSDA